MSKTKNQNKRPKIRVGQRLILRTGNFYTLGQPSVVKYRGKVIEGDFPFDKAWYEVEECYPLPNKKPHTMQYESIALLLEDYQTIDDALAEEKMLRGE